MSKVNTHYIRTRNRLLYRYQVGLSERGNIVIRFAGRDGEFADGWALDRDFAAALLKDLHDAINDTSEAN